MLLLYFVYFFRNKKMKIVYFFRHNLYICIFTCYNAYTCTFFTSGSLSTHIKFSIFASGQSLSRLRELWPMCPSIGRLCRNFQYHVYRCTSGAIVCLIIVCFHMSPLKSVFRRSHKSVEIQIFGLPRSVSESPQEHQNACI